VDLFWMKREISWSQVQKTEKQAIVWTTFICNIFFLDSNALNVEVDLPFVFRFYEMHFSRINISTFDAYATFVGEENVKAQIDVLRRPEIRPSLKNLASESVLFGSPSPDTFIVRWNKSFELVLYNSSVILFKVSISTTFYEPLCIAQLFSTLSLVLSFFCWKKIDAKYD